MPITAALCSTRFGSFVEAINTGGQHTADVGRDRQRVDVGRQPIGSGAADQKLRCDHLQYEFFCEERVTTGPARDPLREMGQARITPEQAFQQCLQRLERQRHQRQLLVVSPPHPGCGVFRPEVEQQQIAAVLRRRRHHLRHKGVARGIDPVQVVDQHHVGDTALGLDAVDLAQQGKQASLSRFDVEHRQRAIG